MDLFNQKMLQEIVIFEVKIPVIKNLMIQDVNSTGKKEQF